MFQNYILLKSLATENYPVGQASLPVPSEITPPKAQKAADAGVCATTAQAGMPVLL